MKILCVLILFILPSAISLPLVHILRGKKFTYGKKVRVGFSFILSDEVHLEDFSKIGSFNMIRVCSINLASYSKIKYFNIIKGKFDVRLKSKASINQFCKITSQLCNIRRSTMELGVNTILGVGHVLDLTHDIVIGDNSILAGARSQIWTHGFYHPSDRFDHWRIDGPVYIGKNVYVSTGVIVCAATRIGDNITVGAGAVVAKSIDRPGLYVNQNLRFIEFTPETSIHRFKEVGKNIYEKIVQ